MLNLKTKITTGLATAGLLAAAFAPTAAFAEDVSVVNNGAFSDNTVITHDSTYVSVNQSNNTNVATFVHASANTGENSASFNTGGNNTIDTGNAKNNVTVVVEGGSNEANLPEECLCAGQGGGDIEIKKNGAFSDNTVISFSKKKLRVSQSSNTNVLTAAHLKSNTGKNKQWFNTKGSNGTTTGNAHNSVGVGVATGDNTLN